MEWLSIDRIVNGIAVCENDDRVKKDIPLTCILGAPKEGDMLFLEDGNYHISMQETRARRQKILELQKKLFLE